MPMISIVVDDERIARGLERLNLFTAGRARAPMGEIARYTKTSIQLRFDRQTDPEGDRWVPSLRVEKHGGQTLRLTSRLRNSFQAEHDDRSASVSTNVPYAAAHNFGVKKIVQVNAHRGTRNTSNKRRGVVSIKTFEVRSFQRHQFTPKRAFMGFNAEDKTEILEVLAEHIKKAGG
jgi:phage virion morphogenesis protein